jgi:orotidine-5'-phosphate decarboxylase
MSSAAPPRLIVALDYADPAAADALVRRLEPSLCRLKVGNELFTRAGPAWVEQWQARGFEVFLDLKYHDIPNTVAAACRAAAALGVWMVNVHALGGRRMLAAAREALDGGATPPWLIGVTVLTSMEAADLREVGLADAPDGLASRLAALAADCGCDGVVCSAREAPVLRAERGRDFVLVTPGIRPDPGIADDQRRTVTPADALRAGSDYLVVGRPVTGASDPLAVLQALAAEAERVPGM